jgi:hypothetical protein
VSDAASSVTVASTQTMSTGQLSSSISSTILEGEGPQQDMNLLIGKGIFQYWLICGMCSKHLSIINAYLACLGHMFHYTDYLYK